MIGRACILHNSSSLLDFEKIFGNYLLPSLFLVNLLPAKSLVIPRLRLFQLLGGFLNSYMPNQYIGSHKILESASVEQ